MWHVSSRSGVATLQTAIHLLLTYLLTASDAYNRKSRQYDLRSSTVTNSEFCDLHLE